MGDLIFTKYRLSQVLRIRKLSTAHYFSSVTNYNTPPHSHDAWEFVFCSQGHVRTYQGSEERTAYEISALTADIPEDMY